MILPLMELTIQKIKYSDTNQFNSVVENLTVARDKGEMKLIEQEIKGT